MQCVVVSSRLHAAVSPGVARRAHRKALWHLHQGPSVNTCMSTAHVLAYFGSRCKRKAPLPDLSFHPDLFCLALHAALQSIVFLSFTSGLHAMSAAVWPGFPLGGPPGLRDLSSPPVFPGTLSTPFGTMGAVVPLAIILTYVRGVDKSATGEGCVQGGWVLARTGVGISRGGSTGTANAGVHQEKKKARKGNLGSVTQEAER